MLIGAKAFYADHPVEFINHWCSTYDPRVAGTDKPPHMPFILFEKQAELVEFLAALIDGQENGLIEKARDMGATWVSAAFSVWLWLFKLGASVGWGSRKEELVDKLGNPDSIFEKIRMLINGIPSEFWPRGFDPQKNMGFMKVINPETGATITGESGDNIGRGGRKLIYFKDESAHYERPEKIEAALADNTNVQIDISSVNGLGNVFHRRREAGTEWEGGPAHDGVVNIFVMDWSDHPAKTQEWYEARKKKAENDGLLHIFAQEVDRNYSAAVERVVIPAEWVKSAIDAHVKLKWPEPTGQTFSGLDVMDGGLDKDAQCIRKGYLLKFAKSWTDNDTGKAARTGIVNAKPFAPVVINYDSVGVGAGVKTEANRLKEADELPKGITFEPWSAGARPLNPDDHLIPDDDESPINKDFFANLKAQGGWHLRMRFEKTHKAVTEKAEFDPDEMISIPSDTPELATIQKELSQPTYSQSTGTLKLMIEKKPDGTKSPNHYDSMVIAYWPVTTETYTLDFL